MAVKRDVLQLNYQQWKQQTLHFHKRLAVVVGAANTGKSYLLKIINKQLQINTAKLLWNQTPISNDVFNPIFVADQLLIEEDLKINRKSYLKHQLLAYINHKVDTNEKFKTLDEQFCHFKRALNEIINDQFLAPINNPAGDYMQAQIAEAKLETYLEKMMTVKVTNQQQVVDPDDYSIDRLKQIWFNLLVKVHTSPTHQQNMLLVDDISANTSPPTWQFFVTAIQQLISEGRHYVVVVCKNPLFLQLLQPDYASLNFVQPDFKIKALQQEQLVTTFIILKTFLTQQPPARVSLRTIKADLPRVVTSEDCKTEYQVMKLRLWRVVWTLMRQPTLDLTSIADPVQQALTYAVASMLNWTVEHDEHLMV